MTLSKRDKVKVRGVAALLIFLLLMAGSFWLEKSRDPAVVLPKQVVLEWSSTRDMSSEENAQYHFEKHGKEFDFHNEKVYVQAANDFVRDPPEGTLTVRQQDGDEVFYNPSKNWFAVVSYKGQIRTFFRLDPKIHGYKSNVEYFNAQASKR